MFQSTTPTTNKLSPTSKNYSKTNCFICFNRPIFYIAALNVTPVKFSCPHSSQPTESNIQISYIMYSGFFALVTGIIYFMCSDTYHYFKETNPIRATELFDSMFLWTSLSILYGMTFIKTRTRLLFIQGLDAFVVEAWKHGIIMLGYKFTKTGKRIFYLWWIFNSTAVILYITRRVYQITQNPESVSFKKVYQDIAYFLGISGSINDQVAAYLLHRCYTVLASQTRRLLKVKLLMKSDQITNDFLLNFEKRLVDLNRLYGSLYLTTKQLNIYYAPTFLMWNTLLIIGLVLYFYRFIVTLPTLSEVTFENSWYLVTVCGDFAFMATVLYTYENLANVNDDILSFLFRYPISGLTVAEAAQVEALIRMLIFQKPVLRISDIISIGMHVLASIVGTVVTYVLVALQFKASWIKT